MAEAEAMLAERRHQYRREFASRMVVEFEFTLVTQPHAEAVYAWGKLDPEDLDAVSWDGLVIAKKSSIAMDLSGRLDD